MIALLFVVLACFVDSDASETWDAGDLPVLCILILDGNGETQRIEAGRAGVWYGHLSAGEYEVRVQAFEDGTLTPPRPATLTVWPGGETVLALRFW